MSFNQLVGQQQLRGFLCKDLSGGRTSHATLLAGPAGSGKNSWGLALAQAILCLSNDQDGACMCCSSCNRFLSGNHPNYYLLYPDERNIKIGQVRDVRERFYLKRGLQVCMIDRAESMTPEASSSLLKIMEEPVEGLYFILLSEKPSMLLSTIRSRCRRYNMQSLSVSETIRLLTDQRNMSEKHAAFLARLSGGLPGYALKLADDDQLENRFGEARVIVSDLANGNYSPHHILQLAAALTDREDLMLLLELINYTCRDAYIRNLGGREELLYMPDQSMVCFDQVSAVNLEEVILIINQLIKELTQTNINRRLLLETMLLIIQRRFTVCPG